MSRLTEVPSSASTHVAREKRLVLNWKFLVILVLCLVPIGGVLYWRYHTQTKLAAEAFYVDSQQQIEDEQWQDAAESLFRYVRFRPDNVNAWCDLARVYGKMAANPKQRQRAIELHYQAIVLLDADDERLTDLNGRLAELLLEVGNFEQAVFEADSAIAMLPKDSDPDPDLVRVRAIANYLRGDEMDQIQAAKALYRIVERHPIDIELVAFAARACRDLGDEVWIARADDLMDRLVAYDENRENAMAWIQRYAYHRDFAPQVAEKDLTQAMKSVTDDPVELLRVGSAALDWSGRPGVESRTEWLDKSIANLEKLLENDPNPNDVTVYEALGVAYQRKQDPEKAIAIWDEGIKRLPRASFELRVHLCRLYVEQRRIAKANDEFAEIQKLVTQILSRPESSDSDAYVLVVGNTAKLLEARLKLAAGLPGSAIRILDDILYSLSYSRSDAEARIIYDAYTLKGDAYLEDGSLIAAADAYERAAGLKLDGGDAALKASQARTLSGDRESAVQSLELSANELNDAEIWFLAAEFHFQAARLQEPGTFGRWTKFDEAVRKGRAARPDSALAPLLEGAREIVENNPDMALRHLKSAEAKSSDDPGFWQRLSVIYQDMDRPADADRALAEFTRLETTGWRPFVVKARLLARRDQLPAAIATAQEAVEAVKQASIGDLPTARRLLLDMYLAADNEDAARDLLIKMQTADEDNLKLLRELAEFDLARNHLKGVEKWIEELREREGDNGVYWRYFEARKRLTQPESLSGDNKDVDDLANKIEEFRPRWSQGMILRGDIHARMERYDEAAACYREALEQGKRLDVYERLIAVLYQSGRYREAMNLVGTLKDSIPDSRRLTSISRAVVESADRIPQALSDARRTLEKRPDDPAAYIWLAQLLMLDGNDDEAEAILRKAVNTSKDNFGTGFALFTFYVSRKPHLAEQVLTQLEKQTSPDMGPVQRTMLLGQCWQQLQNLEAASRMYQAAIDTDAKNETARLLLARLKFTSEPQVAESLLREVLDIKPDSLVARRMLATLLAVGGGAQQWQEVERLLGGVDLVDDARLRAILLTRRGGLENLAKAREILESLVATPAVQPADRILLANAYESVGDISGAKQQYEDLCQGEPDSGHLAVMVNFLLRNGTAEEARPWVDKLAASSTENDLTRLAYLETKTRWLLAADAVAEIEPMLEEYAKQAEPLMQSDVDKKSLYAAMGRIYAFAQLHGQAEPWFRKLHAADSARYRELAVTLAHLDRHDEAVRLALSNHEDDMDPQLLENLIGILSAGNPTKHVWDKTEPIWRKAEVDKTQLAPPLFASAARAIQGRSDRAMKITNAMYQRYPRNVLVLNNLATLLGQMEGQQSKALSIIDKAIEDNGQQPFLLDTKSVILVEMGRPQEAVEALKHLAAIPRPDPRILFRLAVAHMRSGDKMQARHMLSRSLASGLESEVLTGHDKELLDELKRFSAQSTP